MVKPRSQYPPEIRRQMVQLVREGRTPEELSREFEPSAQTIQNWVRRADGDEDRPPIGFADNESGGSHIKQFVEMVRVESRNTAAREAKPDVPPVHQAQREETRNSPPREASPAARPARQAQHAAESPVPRQPRASTSRNALNRQQVRVSHKPLSESLPTDRGDDVHLGQQLRILWERKWIVAATVLVAMSLAFIYTRQMVPLYAAETLLMIESHLPEIVEVDAVVGGLTVDSLTIQSEVSVLESRGLAEKVVEHVKLHDDPEFNRGLRQAPQGRLAQLAAARQWFSDLLGASPDSDTSTALIEQDQNAAVVDAYLKRLQVAAKNKSRVILIKFTSANPATAALVANTVADLYMLTQRESKLEATQQATEWLNERSSALREKVAESERAIETYREDNQLLQGTKGALLSEQISNMNNELSKAGTHRAQLQARLAQVQDLASDPKGIDAAAEVLESPVIQGLREEHVKLVRQKTELSARFNPSHARIVSLDAEIAFINEQIAKEIDKIVRGLENAVGVARAHEALLQTSLEELKAQATKASNAVVKLRELEREAEADRMLLTTFLSRLKETSSQKDIEFHKANARILSRANPPRQPLPKQKVILAVTFAGSLLIGVLLVVFVERRRTGDVFLSGEQIERFANVPYLCLIPLVPVSKGAVEAPASHVVQKPRSAFAESIRGLYASIQLSNIHAPPKTIMFTSSQPNEGKTTIAVSLAKAQALNGKRVVIIDADIRRPGVYRPFQMRNEPGLSEFLQGAVSLEEVIQTDEASGADVISAGAGHVSPFDALCAAPMEELLSRLARSYDLVILDTPPLLAVPDARMLSRKVDATVFAIRWGETKREMATLAMRQIADSNGYIAGVVLSMVDTKKNAKYGYGDSGYYTGAATSYYSGVRAS